MKTVFYAAIAIIIAGLNIQAQNTNAEKQSSVNIETQQITSKLFNNTRTIRILLPPDYHDPKNAETSYPVLYLNDGITVFRRFNIEETVHDLINSGRIPPLIIVGIDNGGSTDKTTNPATDRANEFLPYPDVGFAPDRLYKPDPPNPIGKLYPDFVAEVMTLIKQKYRVKSGAENTGIGGSSYGGVAALYTAMNKPDVFGKLLLESTPLWIGEDKQLLKDARQAKRWTARIYIGLGTKEAKDEVINKEGRAEQDEIIDTVKKNSPGTLIRFVLDEEGKHEASSWSKRFPAALQFLFGNAESQKPALSADTINIFQSGSVTIDGKIEETEWRDAAVFDLTGGGRVFFKHDGEFLYVGARGMEKGWSHLYISEGSGEVSVLHASAALGMSIYRPDKNRAFQPSNPFSWELRDRVVTAETQKKMNDYLSKNFWVASNSNMGNPSEIEFKVKPRNSAGKPIYVAVVYAWDAKKPHFFPAGLKDDTIKEELVFGNTPNDLKFDLYGWAKIILENKRAK